MVTVTDWGVGMSSPMKGARSLAAARRNIEPYSHAVASEGIAAIGLYPLFLLPGLRLNFRLFDLGFLSKPVVFGGIVASIRLYVFGFNLLRFCASFDIIT